MKIYADLAREIAHERVACLASLRTDIHLDGCNRLTEAIIAVVRKALTAERQKAAGLVEALRHCAHACVAPCPHTRKFDAALAAHETQTQTAMGTSIYDDIRAERVKQDAKWGGPSHDDEHTAFDWQRFIVAHAKQAAESICGPKFEDHRTRSRWVAVAALAVAAIESYDRRHAQAKAQAPEDFHSDYHDDLREGGIPCPECDRRQAMAKESDIHEHHGGDGDPLLRDTSASGGIQRTPPGHSEEVHESGARAVTPEAGSTPADAHFPAPAMEAKACYCCRKWCNNECQYFDLMSAQPQATEACAACAGAPIGTRHTCGEAEPAQVTVREMDPGPDPAFVNKVNREHVRRENLATKAKALGTCDYQPHGYASHPEAANCLRWRPRVLGMCDRHALPHYSVSGSECRNWKPAPPAEGAHDKPKYCTVIGCRNEAALDHWRCETHKPDRPEARNE